MLPRPPHDATSDCCIGRVCPFSLKQNRLWCACAGILWTMNMHHFTGQISDFWLITIGRYNGFSPNWLVLDHLMNVIGIPSWNLISLRDIWNCGSCVLESGAKLLLHRNKLYPNNNYTHMANSFSLSTSIMSQMSVNIFLVIGSACLQHAQSSLRMPRITFLYSAPLVTLSKPFNSFNMQIPDT